MKQYIYEHMTNAAGALTVSEILCNFIAAAILAAIIYLSYRMTRPGAVYSKKFNVSLVMLTLVTTLVMSVIGNNIALSLGMVGALSIVRFRTAIKDPRDTGYIFWCIAVGICCGVSDYLIAGIGTVIIFLFLWVFGAIADNERVLLVIKVDTDHLEEAEKAASDFFDGKAALRVRNASLETKKGELIFEAASSFLAKQEKAKGTALSVLSKVDGVKSVNLIRQEDEITQ